MEEINEKFENQANKYLDWGKQQPAEKEEVIEPEAPAQHERITEIVEEKKEESEEERERREREKFIEEIKAKQQKAMEEEMEKLKQVKEDMMKQYQDILKSVNLEEAMEEMKNIKLEEIVTPETDKIFFAWIASRFPKLIEEAEEEIRIKEKLTKEEFEKQKEAMAKAEEKLQKKLKEYGRL